MSDPSDTHVRPDTRLEYTLAQRLGHLLREVHQRQALYGQLDARLAADASSQDLATLLIDSAGVIAEVSDDAARLLGGGTLVGQPVQQVLRAESHDDLAADGGGFSARTLRSPSDTRLICADQTLADGRHLLVLAQAGSVSTTAGPSATELGTAYRATLHDLSNVLASILGYAELALMSEDIERTRQFISEVYDAGKRGQELVQEAQTRLYEAGVRERPADRARVDARPPRILIVDDDPVAAGYLCDALFSVGYHVEGMTDSREALVMFNQDPVSFDLAIVDQNMPGMRGTDLLREFLAVRDDLPVVICTGSGDTLRSAGDTLLKVHGLVTKPVDRDDFLDLVAGILAERNPVTH